MNKYKLFSNHVELYINSETHGEHVVYLDNNDFDSIKNIKWWVVKEGRRYYCACYDRITGNRGLKMHVYLMKSEGLKIDHIDQNGLNNRRNNLRIATHQENRINSPMAKNNKSGYKGIYFEPKKKLYRAMIGFNGKNIAGGRFKNKLLAANRYNELALRYFGEFACINVFSEEEKKEIQRLISERLNKKNIYEKERSPETKKTC